MKYISLLLVYSFYIASCKHSSRDQKLNSSYGGVAIDALVMSEDLVNSPANCRYHLANLFTGSISEGLLRNGALAGLGTSNPAGKSLASDSLYYQGIRIVSIFDWEMATRLASRETGCLLTDVGLQLGVYPIPYARSLSHPFASDVAKLKKAANKINSSLAEFEVVSLDAAEKMESWPKESGYPAAHQAALLQGVREKLKYVDNATRQTSNELERLKGFAGTYNPLAVTFQGKFAEGKGSRFYTEAYLPPFMELNADNLDNVFSWKLSPGIKKHALKKPINISVATLTHVGYLLDPDPQTQPIIKVQLYKDFATPDKIKTRIIFGSLDPSGTEKGALPVNFKNYRDAFYISFFPNVTISNNDSSTIRGLKKEFNDIANQVKVDARIHQLSLTLERQPVPASGDVESLMMKPRFSLKDSDISFRLHRYTKDADEIKKLQAVVFKCVPQAGQVESDCFIDFGAYSDLRDFVLKGDAGVAGGRLTSILANGFKSVLNSVIRFNVKFIVDWNMTEIESAIDQELGAILNDIVNDQAENRRKIQERLESRLFSRP